MGSSVAASILLFVIMGQSNAVGAAPVPSSLYYANYARISVYGTDGQWRQAAEPTAPCVNQVDMVACNATAGAGFVLPAVDAILAQRPNDTAVVVPCARNGSSLTEWQRDLRRDTLYGSCLARTQEAIAGIAEQAGTTPTDYTVLFWQGECDAKAGEPFTTTWAQRFDRLRADWRMDSPDYRVKFVVGVLKPDTPAGYPAWQKIRSYQIATKASDPQQASDYFGTGNVPYDATGVHPTLAGYQAIATGAANAYLRIP